MLDVIVVCYNRLGLLGEVLGALDSQDEPVRVILSDDGTDTPIDWRRYKCVQKYLWTMHDGYQRVARFNEGMSYIMDKYVVLLDGDTVPLSNRWSIAWRESLEGKDVVRGLHLAQDGVYTLPSWFSTTNVGFRTVVLESLGGFDMRYNGYYGNEDHDLGKKIEQRFIEVGIGSHDTCVEHRGGHNGGDVTRNDAVFYSKWGRA